MRVALSAAAAGVIAAAAPAWSQDARQGQRLFEDTPNVSGVSTLTGACTSCHGSVENRRIKIAGDRFAEIAVQTASDRLRMAIASVGAMQQFDALSVEQVQDLAAYIADTPRRSVERLDFSAAAVDTVTPTQFIELSHAVATTQPLQVAGVAVSGPNAARFTRVADTCDQQSLSPGASCRVTISFSSPDTAGTSVPLTFTLRQGTATTTFTRSVTLDGVVAAAPPGVPPPPTDSGSGAVGWGWLASLAGAAALLRRDRRPSISTTEEPTT